MQRRNSLGHSPQDEEILRKIFCRWSRVLLIMRKLRFSDSLRKSRKGTQAFNLFYTTGLFRYPRKTKKPLVLWCFQGVSKEPSSINSVNRILNQPTSVFILMKESSCVLLLFKYILSLQVCRLSSVIGQTHGRTSTQSLSCNYHLSSHIQCKVA